MENEQQKMIRVLNLDTKNYDFYTYNGFYKLYGHIDYNLICKEDLSFGIQLKPNME